MCVVAVRCREPLRSSSVERIFLVSIRLGSFFVSLPFLWPVCMNPKDPSVACVP